MIFVLKNTLAFQKIAFKYITPVPFSRKLVLCLKNINKINKISDFLPKKDFKVFFKQKKSPHNTADAWEIPVHNYSHFSCPHNKWEEPQILVYNYVLNQIVF